MLAVPKLFLTIIGLQFVVQTYGQTHIKMQLEKEQKLIESRIKNTKTLLSKTEKDLKNRTIALTLLEKNLALRERLVRNIDQQIRTTEQRIVELQSSVIHLNSQTTALKKQYQQMLLYAYKNRGTIDKLMFVFSSENFNQANKRAQYLNKITDVRKKQVLLIKSNLTRIVSEEKDLQNQKLTAIKLSEQKKSERETLLEDRIKQQEVFNTVKNEEASLRTSLLNDEKNKQRIKKEIKIAIDKEIRNEINRQKELEKQRDNERKNKTNNGQTQNTNSNSTTTNSEKSEQKANDFGVTPEAKITGNNFASNKGRLPYPVSSGTIVERFGRNAHPTINNVVTENNGVDISTLRGTEVRSVFEGEVSSVILIPGAGKVVILSHGNYKSVYANLQDVYVSKGNKVNHKQLLGSLMAQGNISVLHFEIHVVNDNGPQKLNPELWLSK
jgi:septal ring factor EnvC (AmiA/AmiB activator)